MARPIWPDARASPEVERGGVPGAHGGLGSIAFQRPERPDGDGQKLEAALRGRDGGDPPNVTWICRRLIYHPRDWQIEEATGIGGFMNL